MKLFGNAITDRQKASVQKNINMQIEDIKQRKSPCATFDQT